MKLSDFKEIKKGTILARSDEIVRNFKIVPTPTYFIVMYTLNDNVVIQELYDNGYPKHKRWNTLKRKELLKTQDWNIQEIIKYDDEKADWSFVYWILFYIILVGLSILFVRGMR